MSTYDYEIVNSSHAVVQRWNVEQSSDEQAIAGLEGVALLDFESVRVFRAGGTSPFAVRDIEFGTEVFA